MKLVANEGVDSAVVSVRASRYEVLYIAEAAPGLKDGEVLELANSRNALLLTADKDFGELVFRLGQVHSGVVLLRLMGLASDRQAGIVSRFEQHNAKMRGAFRVIAPKTVRVRPKLSL